MPVDSRPPVHTAPGGEPLSGGVPGEHVGARSGVPEAQTLAHAAAVSANWRVFHVGVPPGFASYVYRYRDGGGGLLYVGMTSAARKRAAWHWENSDWRSWVMSAEYIRCHSRDEAFQLETKIRRDEEPLFVRVTGNAPMIAELDAKYLVNHVTGECSCMLADAGPHVIESVEQDPSG